MKLAHALEVPRGDIYSVPGMLDMTCLGRVANLDRPELKYEPWEPVIPRRLRSLDEEPVDIFGVIRHRDLIVHHPYDDFHASVERFVVNAVDDPAVLAIKQTVYRTSGDSPIRARADPRGRARTPRPCAWWRSRRASTRSATSCWATGLMERAGVHVVYGIPALKTHGKLCLVVRQEGDAVVRYVHIGTGNYNPATAQPVHRRRPVYLRR